MVKRKIAIVNALNVKVLDIYKMSDLTSQKKREMTRKRRGKEKEKEKKKAKRY